MAAASGTIGDTENPLRPDDVSRQPPTEAAAFSDRNPKRALALRDARSYAASPRDWVQVGAVLADGDRRERPREMLDVRGLERRSRRRGVGRQPTSRWFGRDVIGFGCIAVPRQRIRIIGLDTPLYDCVPVCSLFLSPSFGKKYALNPVDEFTEVQESGNHLPSSTSAEVSFGFQHFFFKPGWVQVLGQSVLTLSMKHIIVFLFALCSYPPVLEKIML